MRLYPSMIATPIQHALFITQFLHFFSHCVVVRLL